MEQAGCLGGCQGSQQELPDGSLQLWGCGTEVSLKEQTKPVSHLESLLKSTFSAVCELG